MWKDQCICWEVMECQEGEFSTAIMEPGTRCVLMVGVPLERRLELCVRVLPFLPLDLVLNILLKGSYQSIIKFSHSVPSVVDYGRGTIPILPVNVQCTSGTRTLSECFNGVLDVGQCTNVAGVDCQGMHHLFRGICRGEGV